MNCFTLHAQHEAQLACEHKRKTRQTQCRQVGARLRDDSSPSRIKGLEFKFSSFESKQDLRVDLPTIGLETLKDCKKANIKGIVVRSGQNIFLDKQEGLKFANRNNIFVIAK